jgi:hypothetical protein
LDGTTKNRNFSVRVVLPGIRVGDDRKRAALSLFLVNYSYISPPGTDSHFSGALPNPLYFKALAMHCLL